MLARILGFVSVGFGLYLAFEVDTSLALAFGILALIGTVALYRRGINKAKGRCSSHCVAVGRAVAYLGWQGSLHQFEVISMTYARDFMLANQNKLVNLSPQGKNLLSGAGGIAKSSARTPRRYQS
jgi:hypothetical protein